MRIAVLLTLLLAALVPMASAFDDVPRNELVVGSSQRAVAATAGGGCYGYGQSAGAGYPSRCAYGGPLALGPSLYVRPGRLVALDFDAPVVRLDLRVADHRPYAPDGGGVGEPDSRVPAEPEGGAAPARRWLARVPERWLEGPLRLHAHAFYGSSPDRFEWDLNYEFGLQVIRPGTGRVKVPRLRGLPLVRALRELERRGLGWRLDGGSAIAFDTGPPPPPDAAGPAESRHVASQDLRPGRRVRRTTVVDLVTRRR